jgi:hypothetical protein
MTYVREQVRERLAGQLRRAWRRWRVGMAAVAAVGTAADTGMTIDTSLATSAGHQPSRRRSFPEAADGQSADRSARYNFLHSSQGRPCGRPAAALAPATTRRGRRGWASSIARACASVRPELRSTPPAVPSSYHSLRACALTSGCCRHDSV